MYNKIKEKFIASPTNPQYVFSHHDLARIAKGVFIYSPKSRLRARKSGHGFGKGDLTVIQSMPDLQTKNSMTVGLPDPRLVFKNRPVHHFHEQPPLLTYRRILLYENFPPDSYSSFNI